MTPLDRWLSSYPSSTRGLYSRTLAGFIAATRKPVEQATQEDVATYHARISELAPSTVSTKLAILSSCFAYLVKTGARADNPMVAIAHRPKVDKKGSVKWLDADEQRALLDAVQDERLGARNSALIWILLHGLRLAEVVSLNVEDYRYGELRFTGKGGKSRIVPLLSPTQVALQRYLGNRRTGPMFRAEGAYVGTRSSTHKRRLSRRQVQRIVAEATARIGKKAHPHALRHSFATRHVKAGTGLPQLQKLMGHSALSSTNLYIHLDTEDVREAMQNDPLAPPQELQVIEGGKVGIAG